VTGKVTVRLAGPGDLSQIVALRLALIDEYSGHPLFRRLRSDFEARARTLFGDQLASASEVMFIASRRGETAGILRCVDTAAAPLLLPARYCYVSSAYVKPEHRRAGVLRALLQHARAWCTERGLTEMRLHTASGAEAAAATWSAFGFEVVEEVRRLELTPVPA
jgi:ribosomal protein S18 acetylase RimI-like enzyme